MHGIQTHYDVLRIGMAATPEEVEQAYRQRIARMHRRIAAGRASPAEEFNALELAYSVLRDPVARTQYDAWLAPRTESFRTTVAAGAETPYSFSFAGSGGEYFRIWIVNLLLSILTLGIYSAWAKVRREKYFHSNTLLDGSGFEYHGQPLAILKGRVIALVLFGLLSYAEHISIVAYVLTLLAFSFVFPWLMVSAYRFRTRNTSYRALHFSFTGAYRESFIAFVVYGVLCVLTLYLLFPVWLRKMRSFVINHLRYGQGAFQVDVTLRAVYQVMMVPLLLVLLVFLMGLLAGAFQSSVLKIVFVFLLPLLMFGSVILIPYVQMHLNNLFWNNTRFDKHRFESDMRFGRYLGIILKNWFLMMLTLGLYWPWAKVALVNYRLSRTRLMADGSLNDFIARASEQEAATGDEAAELFDFDVGF